VLKRIAIALVITMLSLALVDRVSFCWLPLVDQAAAVGSDKKAIRTTTAPLAKAL